MKLREFRRSDGPRLFALLKTEFPEEEAMLGMRPEGFERILRRLYRADTRILLGLLRAVHRSPFHLYVVEEAGTIAAMTMLSFAARAGFLSTVVVAPEFRRRGYARQLIELARAEAARRGRPYVALRVLAANAPARTLYASAGYEPLEQESFFVLEGPIAFAADRVPGSIRPYRRSDAGPLAELANRTAPEKVREVLPLHARSLSGNRWADRIFSAETGAWVVDRGQGAEAYLSATSTPTTEAAHLSTPIASGSVAPELLLGLVRTAGVWLAARRPARIVTSVPESGVPARRALEEAGFRETMGHLTLFRSSR